MTAVSHSARLDGSGWQLRPVGPGAIWMPCEESARQIGATPNRSF